MHSASRQRGGAARRRGRGMAGVLIMMCPEAERGTPAGQPIGGTL